MQEARVQLLGQEDPLEKELAFRDSAFGIGALQNILWEMLDETISGGKE